MDLIGKCVFHRYLKKPNQSGYIINVDVNGNYIDISFVNDDVYSRRFLIPQAFESISGCPPYLYTNDKDVSCWIDSLKKKHICSVCKVYSSQLKHYEDISVCVCCEKEIVDCHHCGKKILRSNSKKDPWFCGYYFCDNCYSDLFKTCSICGQVRSLTEISNNKFLPINEIVCDFCAETLLTRCEGCDCLYPDENIKETKGHKYCLDCFAVKVGVCSSCKEPSIDLIANLCESCRTKSAYYNYLSSPQFFDQKIVRICGERSELRRLRTKRLMSRLNGSCSEDPFDILIFEEYINYNGRSLDLIVVPAIPGDDYNVLPLSCTMTEFKKDESYCIRRVIEKYLDDEKSISKKFDEEHNLIIMHKAYILRAMTYADMDYGDRWYGQDYCEEGNKYGDTSNFYIVGALEKVNPKKKCYRYVPFIT